MINREDYLIDRLKSNYIGDDGAIVEDKIYSMDAFFEGIHFKREWMSLTQIARKAMLINISDAIAMNAKPLYALITLCLPLDITKSGIDKIINSIDLTANEFGCEIIGGDTILGERLDFSITIISKSDNPLTRKGLKEGDLLAYTGVLGESRRDLNRLFSGKKIDKSSRFIEPILRGDFISKAREYLRVGMDISDGLYCDCNKLLDYNSIGFEPTIKIDNNIGMSGEEYEMLIGFDSKNLDTILDIANSLDLKLTIFGKVKDNNYRFNCIDHHK
jgi:thiamine-monophosphate kinase